ncbi:MAG: hypothetical protein AABX82_05465, partial [Nanoarchaeota archaeon]
LLILVSVLFYFIIIPPNLDRTRYLMILIPALAILSAKYIGEKTEEWNKKEWLLVGVCSVMIFISFLWINQNNSIVSYESQQNPIVLLKSGSVDFSIPVFTETDNSGFLLHFSIFAVAYGISAIAGFALFTRQNKTVGKIALIMLLSISIGYNFVVAEDYGLHWTSPNYSDGIKELILYAQRAPLQEPLYLLKNYELQWYLRDNYSLFVSDYGISETDETKIAAFAAELDEHGGTVIFTDMPPIDKNGLLWQTINEECVKEFSYLDKDVEIAWVWGC